VPAAHAERGILLDTGLVIIFTGDGKGKTSAAIGMAVRASGHKMYVSVLQFIKSPAAAGEARAAERLAPELDFISLGKGFVSGAPGSSTRSEHQQAAKEALKLAWQRMQAGAWDLLVLDEINNAVHLGLLDLADVMELVKSKPAKLHLVLTGRNAHPDLIAAADLVTEMRAIKHPYDRGVPAQRGIDF
jgi:cob(I)alamin adenosyltransferase